MKTVNKDIKSIITNTFMSTEDKLKMLDNIVEDIDLARNIIVGKFKYCAECDDYYLSGAFQTEKKIEERSVLVYVDPMNSGGNETKKELQQITYSICPKGHRHEIKNT